MAVHAELPDAHVVRDVGCTPAALRRISCAVMRRLAAGDRPIDVVSDQTGSPTYAKDLVDALLEIAARRYIRAPIRTWLANAGRQPARPGPRGVSAAGADPAGPRWSTRPPSRVPAHRPVFSALAMDGSVRAGLSALRPWRAALTAALAVPVDGGLIPSTP